MDNFPKVDSQHGCFTHDNSKLAERARRLADTLENHSAYVDAERKLIDAIGLDLFERLEFLPANLSDCEPGSLTVDASLSLDEPEFWALSPWFAWSSWGAATQSPRGSLALTFTGRSYGLIKAHLAPIAYEFRINCVGPANADDQQTLKDLGKIIRTMPEIRQAYDTVVCS